MSLSAKQIHEDDRLELLHGTIRNMALQVCNTVTDWSDPRPLLPVSSVTAWIRAGHLSLELFGETGESAWMDGCSHLKMLLRAGHAMYQADIA